jgi:ankyrin repeat protein
MSSHISNIYLSSLPTNITPFVPDLPSKSERINKKIFSVAAGGAASRKKELISLLKEKPDLNIQNENGETPLHIAVNRAAHCSCYFETDMVELLLENGANPDLEDKNGKSPIDLAIKYRKDALTLILLKKSAPDKWKDHLVLKCLENRLHESAEYLIRNNANIDFKDEKGFSCLHYAVKTHSEHSPPWTPLLLLHRGADINAVIEIEQGHSTRWEIGYERRYEKGFTPLHIAVVNNNTDMIEFLAERGATLDFKDGQNPLHMAINEYSQYSSINTIDTLIRLGADINLLPNDKHNGPPLHYALSLKKTSVVYHLLRAGCDINARDMNGRTALFEVVYKGLYDLSDSMLYKREIDLNIIDNKDETVLDFAISQRLLYLDNNYSCYGHEKKREQLLTENAAFIKNLISRGAKTNKVQSLLNIANEGHTDFIKFLLDRKVSLFSYHTEDGARAINQLLIKVSELKDPLIRAAILSKIYDSSKKSWNNLAVEFVTEAVLKEEHKVLKSCLLKRNHTTFNDLTRDIKSLRKRIKSATSEEEKKSLEDKLKTKAKDLETFNHTINNAIGLFKKGDVDAAKKLLKVKEKVSGRTLICSCLIGAMADEKSKEKALLVVDRLLKTASLKDIFKYSKVFSLIYDLLNVPSSASLRKIDVLERVTKRGFKDFEELSLVQFFIRIENHRTLNQYAENTDFSLTSLKEAMRALFEVNFNLKGIEDIKAKYEQTFGISRNPSSIFIYAASLYNSHDRGITKRLLSTYVKDVLEGHFLEERYSVAHSEHLRAISEVDGGLELLEIWKKGKTLLLEDPYKSILSSMPSAPNYLDIFKLKIVTDGHLGAEWESKYPYLFEVLNDDDRLENVIDRIDIDLVAKKEEATQSPSEEISKEISAMEVQRKVLALCQPNANVDEVLFKELIDFFVDTEFSNDLKGLLTTHLASPKKTSAYTVCDTDDPQDIILMGQEIQASCQRLNGDARLNCGLLGPLLDGKYRIIAVKDTEGRLVARCLLKLLWDKELKRPVLFQERLYVNGHCNGHAEALNKMCLLKAQEMNITLLNKEYFSRGGTYPNAVSSIGGRSCFEYVDALGGVRSQVYDISKCQIVWEPTASL